LAVHLHSAAGKVFSLLRAWQGNTRERRGREDTIDRAVCF
jgi:hypothetical protein